MTTLLEEKDAIHETLANYCFYVDAGELDQWANLFTEDATFDAGALAKCTGRATIQRFLAAALRPWSTTMPPMKHCVMNEIITVNGDEARAKSYIIVILAPGEGQLSIGLAGRYEDQLVKQEGRWLFKTRTVHPDFLGDLGPLAGALAKGE